MGRDFTLMLLVDALRADYVERMPFLRSLARLSAVGALRECFGFVPRQAYFGGLDASTYGYTNMYRHDPAASPFRVARGVDEASLAKLVQMQVLWRSKLEAALIFAEKSQDKIAARLMLDGVIAVQNCKNVRVILEALLTICPHLAKLDVGCARYLLNLAAETAEKTGQTADLERARRSLAELQPVSQRLVA